MPRAALDPGGFPSYLICTGMKLAFKKELPDCDELLERFLAFLCFESTKYNILLLQIVLANLYLLVKAASMPVRGDIPKSSKSPPMHLNKYGFILRF